MEHQRAHAPTLHRGGCRRGYHAASPPREPATPYPEHLRDLVEDYLEDLDFSGTGDGADASATAGLVEAMRHSLLAGGKRIRPVLALATCEGLGRPARTLLPAAAAIELVHTYSLIHDDLPAMDDDDLRRGRPTCHRAFGEDTAILAGDALFAEAIRLVAERQPGGPTVRLAILREISRAAGLGGMVGGQFLDLTDAARSSPAALARMHALKTGRLISCAVECALAVADPPPDTARGLRGYARELGLLIYNALEEAADGLSPWVARLKREFAHEDCLAAQQSGSGSAYFGICRHARHARRVARRLQARGLGRVYAVSTSN